MFFAGLTSAYIVSRSGTEWLKIALPRPFWFSTTIIILSSISLNLSKYFIKNNKILKCSYSLLLTFFLGISFSISQFWGWKILFKEGVFFTGPGSNLAGSYLYLLSGLHLIHLIAGLIALFVILIKSFLGKYDSKHFLGIKLISIFWHFLGILWIYLFVFLNLFG